MCARISRAVSLWSSTTSIRRASAGSLVALDSRTHLARRGAAKRVRGHVSACNDAAEAHRGASRGAPMSDALVFLARLLGRYPGCVANARAARQASAAAPARPAPLRGARGRTHACQPWCLPRAHLTAPRLRCDYCGSFRRSARRFAVAGGGAAAVYAPYLVRPGKGRAGAATRRAPRQKAGRRGGRLHRRPPPLPLRCCRACALVESLLRVARPAPRPARRRGSKGCGEGG